MAGLLEYLAVLGGKSEVEPSFVRSWRNQFQFALGLGDRLDQEIAVVDQTRASSGADGTEIDRPLKKIVEFARDCQNYFTGHEGAEEGRGYGAKARERLDHAWKLGQDFPEILRVPIDHVRIKLQAVHEHLAKAFSCVKVWPDIAIGR